MRVVPVEQLADNYAYILFEEGSGEAAVVDVAEAEPVLQT
ncbi:MAG: hydroxyacylglutathione hydrolase, partial [Myxococcales bacterium]